MKILITSFVFVLATSLAKADFQDYTGCFQAISYNGIFADPNSVPSEMKLIPETLFYQSVDRQELTALEVRVSITGGTYPTFYNHQIITEGATITESENKLDVQFKDVVHNLFSGKDHELSQFVTIEKTGDLYKIKLSTNTEVPSSTATVEMRKTNCH